MKKAFEIQFNWIYILVISAVLLIIFYNITGSITRFTRSRSEMDATLYFDQFLANSLSKTENSIDLHGFVIENSCNLFYIGDAMKTYPYTVFSPETIAGEAITATMASLAPFTLDKHVLLTSPNIAYVFTADLIPLYQNMPDKTTTFLVNSVDEFSDPSYYNVRFVTTQPPSPYNTNLQGVTFLQILSNTKTIKYFNHDLEFEKETYYLDTADLYGAIYSENAMAYECSINKLFKNIENVAVILSERIDIIIPILPAECPVNEYQQAKTVLGSLITETSNDLSKAKFANIKNFVDDLESIQNQIPIGCPGLY